MTTAYGRPALDALRQVVSEAKGPDLMAPVTVLVPHHLAGITARRHLATYGVGERGPGVAGLHVTTLPRLAEQLAAHVLRPRRPATASIVAAAWRQALLEGPGCFGRVKDHPATVRALVQAHRELRDLSPAGRDRVRDATVLAPDLLRLHESVVDRLAEQWYDATDLLHAATTLVASAPEPVPQHGHVVLFLPQALTRAEAGFARALAAPGVTVIAGMTGVQRADRAVRRTLTRLGLPEPTRTPRPAVASRVLHASDADDEVRLVVREVVRTLEGGTPAHRVAVLHGAAQPYARLLHEHLAAAGLTVNGPATRPMVERAICRGFLGVLDLARTGMPRAATFTALAEAPVRDLAGTTTDPAGGRVRVSPWERISRAAHIVGGAAGGADWGPKLAAYLAHERTALAELEAADDPSPARLENLRRSIEEATALAGFAGRLRARLDLGVRATTWPELGGWALDLFHDLYGAPGELGSLPPEDQYAAAVLESLLTGLPGLASVEAAADLEELLDLLAAELGSALPRVGRFGEGVFVGPLSAAVGLDLDAAYVVGLAEDGYPGRLLEEALLSDRLRAAADDELEQGRDRLDAKHRHLLAAFAGAPQVTASFPRGDLRRSTERLPSRFLLPTLRAVTGNRDLAASEWDRPGAHRADTRGRLVASESFASTVRTTAAPATEQEWRLRAAAAGVQPADPAVDAARRMLHARAGDELTRFDGHLAGADGLPDYARGDLVVSPTALETYASCPQRFFAQRLLRVEPLEDPEEVVQISPADAGTFIHEAVDALVREAGADGTLPSYGVPWSSHHHRRLAEIAVAKAEEFAARGVTGHPRLWAAERAQLLLDLDRMLDDDSGWRRGRRAAVLGSELAFGMAGAAPVVVELPGGRVGLRGSADKVDRTEDGVLLVTDIKTGRPDRFRVIETDPVAAGTKLQLPVYAHAARAAFGGERVEAAYWFVRKDHAGRRIGLVLDEEVERRYAETLATLVGGIAQGLFVGRPSERPAWGYVECDYCTPDGVGHEEARARYERKRRAPALAGLMALLDPDALAPQDAGGEG